MEKYKDKNWLYREYIIKGRSAYDMAKECRGRKKGPATLKHRIALSKSHTRGEWVEFYDESVYQRTRGTVEYVEWRDSMFVRDDFKCQECGNRGGDLELHHIVPCRDYEEGIMEDSNAITLCKNCHRETFGKEYEFVDKYKTVVGAA